MANGSNAGDLLDLVDRPSETLAVEVKGHLDLKDGVHQANLARHICALANYGGGYIVFGFDDDLVPMSLPSDLSTAYHRDLVSSIIATHLSPSFLCDVVYVRATNGIPHPVIRVPPHGIIPICARKNGPHDSKGRPQGIVSPHVYIRAVGPNGPESIAISRPEDWEKLIRRCVLADRTALLGLIEGVLSPGKSSASEAEEPLKLWHEVAKRRYLTLIEQFRPQWKTPLIDNHYQLSYMINHTEQKMRIGDVIPALEVANAQTRELVWTGWSMFYPFNRPEIAPHIVTDEAIGHGNEELFEGSLLAERSLDTTLPDFWRVSADGKVSLLRAYREDREPYPQKKLNPGQWLSPFLLAREIAEFVRHALAMSENFPSASSLAFRCEWHGLKGRRIADPEADWSKERIARTDHRLFAGVWPISDLSARWPAIVAEISSSVTRLFDSELELSEQWIQRNAPRFRSM